MAFFHLSVWLIGQGGWKFSCGWFYSLQFTAQAEKWCWVGNSDFYYSFKLEILIQLQNEPA